MDKVLPTGSLLGDRFHIAEPLGQGQDTSAYLAADLNQGGAWSLVWESLEMFRMRRKPPNVLQYLTVGERHYLVLRLEGQDLGLVFTAAGVVQESWATLWMSQVCDSIGQWHNRREERTICLEVGDIRLAHMRLLSTGRALVPGCEVLTQAPTSVVAGQTLAFSAPEKEAREPLTVRSDVYALGAATYCLVTGMQPPDHGALRSGEAELVPPRKIQRKLSGRLEKVVLKAMDLDPQKRHESAMQLSFDLDRCVPRRLRRHKIGSY